MIVHKEYFSTATSGGEWSDNTESIPGAMCHHVYAKSASPGTVFDLTITDDKDVEIRGYTDITGCVNDLTPFIVRGIHTLSITNATADESVSVLLCCNVKCKSYRSTFVCKAIWRGFQCQKYHSYKSRQIRKGISIAI